MRPKGKLLALLVMFAAVAGLTATGAFTTVEADRTATVETAGDANALLGLDVHSDSEFADTGGDTIQITLNSSNSGSSENPSGVNLDAITSENETLNITNNGQDPITVSLDVSTSNGEAAFYATNSSIVSNTSETVSDSSLSDSDAASTGSYYLVGTSTGDTTTTLELASGEKATLGLYIDTIGMTNKNNAVFDGDTITITAEEDPNP